MTHEIDSAFDKLQRYTTDDVQKARRQRSTNAQSKENYVINVVFLLLDRKSLDSKKNDDFEKHHASEDEEIFNE
jgi:hypothetical protein